MTPLVDLFWSFRSPYSYLVLPRTCELVRRFDVGVRLRPVYPLAVRDPTFFGRTPPHFARYVMLDSARVEHQNNPSALNLETVQIRRLMEDIRAEIDQYLQRTHATVPPTTETV